MHELEVIEGELIVRATDWLADRRHGTRHVRYGGYLGAPTSELVLTGLGWVGTTWLLQPARQAVLSPSLSVETAVRQFELAEAAGASAPLWVPLRPEVLMEASHWKQGPPGARVVWRGMVRGDAVMVIEALGPLGVPCFLIALDGVPLTGSGGAPILYEEEMDALYAAET